MPRTHFLAQAIDADPVISFARDKFDGNKFGGEMLERDDMNSDKEQLISDRERFNTDWFVKISQGKSNRDKFDRSGRDEFLYCRG